MAVITWADLFGNGDPEQLEDPYPVYARLRREDPVVAVQGVLHETWFVTRHSDVLEVLLHDEIYSNRANERGIGQLIGRTIVEMDGDEHHRLRTLIMPALAPRALDGALTRTMERIAHQLIDRFVHEGRADLVEAFTFTYPLRVFTEILGLPGEDHAQVHRWAAELTRIALDPTPGIEAAGKLAEYLEPVVARRRAEPGPGLISDLVQAEVDGARLTEREVIDFLRLLVLAGSETTYHLLGTTLVALLAHPDRLERLRDDRSAMQAVLDEALRWESPVQVVARETTRATELGGVELPAGAELLVGIGSANRDEAVFAEPDRFDPDRDTSEHLAFGKGKHYCAGSRLAAAEARAGLGALLDRLPELALAPGARPRILGMAFRGPRTLAVRFRPPSTAVA